MPLSEKEINEELNKLNSVAQKWFERGRTDYLNGYRHALETVLEKRQKLTEDEP